ncbi:unnamed protein product [Mytilus edulis]|uniref:Endonuclease/exonuclease/phosphatase domain-containing protein n=1 Tax=Mytilus edulis TaxID=6550 RepID=A0A8S3RVQ8_MYTED|nr:unnamed protein product [Mytilus edulis]
MSETKVTFGQSEDEALAPLKNIQNIVSKLESRIENIEKEVSKIEDIKIQLISMSSKINDMEKRVQEVEDRNSKIEDSVEEMSQIVNSALDKYTDNSDQIEILNKAIKALQNTKDNRKLDEVHVSKLRSLEEDVVEMKWRSMHNNLIFSGLRYQPDEDTEIKIRDFINKELGLYNTISFGNVHRFCKKIETDKSTRGELKFSFLNICGLKSKSLASEFSDLVINNDISIFVETKTDKLDIISLPNGYSCFSKHRSKFKRKSGGIVIIYKSELEKFLTFPKTKSEFLQWIQFSKDLLNDNVLMGCVYIPPEGSKYSSVDAFTEIENEFLHLSEPNLKNVLIGDFNAKTSTLPYYVIPDQHLLEILNTDDTQTMHYFSDYNGL